MIDLAKTVREIALEQPTSIRVFENFGIDYCCGGRKPLGEACADRKLSVKEVVEALDSAAGRPATSTADWQQSSLAQLIDHIVVTHHAYVKRELPRLATLAQKVVNRHGETQAHLPAIQEALAQLDQELTHHLGKEEHVLFPYVARLEAALGSGSTLPERCFGSVVNPIAMMTREHDAAGMILAGIRRMSDNFTTPAGACPTYHAFYDGLKEFEQDLHQHIHLENNILFPRAIEMELTTVGTAA
ncbi:MAG TPA: iron-sulfur cluster repair di-iron protein [Terracidiphilus sp.]|nr:iron-sulfur cluster repair di-iron protein [Terracidiphilus sp.]